MLEFAGLYRPLKDLFGLKAKKLSPEQILEKRQKWKPEIEEQLAKGLKRDVIIRDVRHLNRYPDLDPDKPWILRKLSRPRPSSWFKVGLMGTYESGIYAGLEWKRLEKTPTGWREATPYCEGYGEHAMLMGRIPYEHIVNIDWAGDEFYGEAQIYCEFRVKRAPYRDVGYYLVREPENGPRYFTLACGKDEIEC